MRKYPPDWRGYTGVSGLRAWRADRGGLRAARRVDMAPGRSVVPVGVICERWGESMCGSIRRRNSVVPSGGGPCAWGPGGQAASRGAAAGWARPGPVRVFAHRRTGSVRGRSGRRLGVRADCQLNGPVPGLGLAGDLVHRRAVYGLLLGQEGDELPELGPVRADELDGGLLRLAHH